MSKDGVQMDGTVVCKEGHLLKGINSPQAKVQCKSRSGRPKWVLEDGEDLPNCLKACTSDYDCEEGMVCEASKNTSLCQPQHCHKDELTVLNGRVEFPIQSSVASNTTLLPIGYVGQVICNEHFILDFSDAVTQQISIICAKDNICGTCKWTTLSGGKYRF